MPPPRSCIRQATFDTIVIAFFDEHKPNFDFLIKTDVERQAQARRDSAVTTTLVHWLLILGSEESHK